MCVESGGKNGARLAKTVDFRVKIGKKNGAKPDSGRPITKDKGIAKNRGILMVIIEGGMYTIDESHTPKPAAEYRGRSREYYVGKDTAILPEPGVVILMATKALMYL